MSIVCGTDFSPAAAEAVRVAALLSKTLGETLVLVHVIDELGAEITFREDNAVYNATRTRLRAAARRARDAGADVTEELVPGIAADVLARSALRANARMLVVSSLGQHAHGRALLGSVAERLARTSPVPVLVVRLAAPFERWLAGERPLAVTVGADPTESSDAALRWVEALRRIRPCDVTVGHVAAPSREHDRLGVPGPVDTEQLHPDVERTLLRDLKDKAGELAGDGEVRFLVRQRSGRTDESLVALAELAEADLLVVGSHQRSRIDRLWRGSVSRGVLLVAPMSVASVPRTSPAVREVQTIPTLAHVLVGTDFSDPGNRAVLHAISLVSDGGTVHVVHVLTPEIKRRPFTVTEMVATGGRSEEWRRMVQEVHDRLERLVPAQAASRGVRVTVDVLEGDVVEEVFRAAERLGVDVICLGSHGRSRLKAALLGSVARGVIAKSTRPILVVPPREP